MICKYIKYYRLCYGSPICRPKEIYISPHQICDTITERLCRCDNCDADIHVAYTLFDRDLYKVDFCHKCADQIKQYPIIVHSAIQILQQYIDIDCVRLVLYLYLT